MHTSKHTLCLASWTLGAVTMLLCPPSARAESARRERLRTGEEETPESLTDTPLKAAMQNLFLQEDAFPQRHLQMQVGARAGLVAHAGALTIDTSALLELGLAHSWTLSLRVPVSLAPTAQRGLGNLELELLYALWVSSKENLRITAFVSNVLPSPSAAGESAFAHDVSVIGYARFAPVHFQAVATADLSYGKGLPDGPRVRPEGAVAAILKLGSYAVALEATAQRQFRELRYLTALGFFWYPGSVEIGVAGTCDLSAGPIGLGAIALVSYAPSSD